MQDAEEKPENWAAEGFDIVSIEGVKAAYMLQCGAAHHLTGGDIVYCNKKIWRIANGNKLTLMNMPTCVPYADGENYHII